MIIETLSFFINHHKVLYPLHPLTEN